MNFAPLFQFNTIFPFSNSNSNSSLYRSQSSYSMNTEYYKPRTNVYYNDFVLTNKDIMAFKRLLEEKVVINFLEWDKCCMLADKYLMAYALTYFKRANLSHKQYTPCYLFVALYLAHDMEEDDYDLKNDLIVFAMGSGNNGVVGSSAKKLFFRKRDKLWHQLNMRTAVNHLCCESLMENCLAEHPIWRRERTHDHSGVAVPHYIKCYVHKELRLCNSYYECHIRCIICEIRRFYNCKTKFNPTLLGVQYSNFSNLHSFLLNHHSNLLNHHSNLLNYHSNQKFLSNTQHSNTFIHSQGQNYYYFD